VTGSTGLRAVVLGGVAWNTMIYLDRFPQAVPHTVFPIRTHQTVGSSGAGKALNLAGLGVDVTLWALVGDDEDGKRIRHVMQEAGVTLITELDPAGTARHVNLMDRSGERISIFENPGSLNRDVDPTPVDAILEGADLVSVTIHDHCRVFLPTVDRVGSDTWVDIHDYDGVTDYHSEFIDAADYLFVSSVRLENWRSFAERRIEAGSRAVVVTHGAGGSSGITADQGWCDVPASRVDEFVDTNGAGDAFFAGFAVAWLGERSLDAAMRAGADNAARAIASPDLAPRPPG
jgi:acarbose 7IV-phosphotransferase